LAAILVAFWSRPVWAQKELAREVGVSSRAVRRHLEELCLAGWPLDREEEHPQVYWTIPKGWFPGGVLLEPAAVALLVRVLLRSPNTPERAKLLDIVKGYASRELVAALERILPPRTSAVEDNHLPALLDALGDHAPLRLRYYTASKGRLSDRTVSVQRVLIGPPARFVAWCHETERLLWFRVDYVSALARPPGATYRQVDDVEVDAIIGASVDGFHGGKPLPVAFFVRDPDARWVAQNLPDGLSGTSEANGLLVETETAGLLPVARFVVGLGEAAECRTPELAALVRTLAEGALARAQG
jgi:proteasome accessory factor C